jgi:choline dehydrogenase-like flavoprotein
MFTIRFPTADYRPDLAITIRNNVDGWAEDIPGEYKDDEWRFLLDEDRYPAGLVFKFLLERTYWMIGPNLFLQPVAGGDYLFAEDLVRFPPITELVVENGYVQTLFFKPNFDVNHQYDVIVIGSGIGGGVLADQLSDLGVDVLVLEAGSYLFPSHIANLPRQHQVGKFDKHVWGLFDEFKVQNYANTPDSQYFGGQAFNLGGRSVFWGGLIPRMSSYELDTWPRQQIRWYLEDAGYQRAEDLMNRSAQLPSAYHQRVKQALRTELPDFNHFDAPVAVQYANNSLATIPTGMFSTADLLMESRLTTGPQGNQSLTINLNQAVTRLLAENDRVTGVVAYDLIANRERTYRAKVVVLAAGTIESAKIALLSGLQDPNGKMGVGITDHPIFFTHFALPANSPFFETMGNSKVLSQHRLAASDTHPYNMVLELGADFNQGRYVDDDILKRHQQEKGNTMLCELVFLFNAALMDENRLQQLGPSFAKPLVTMHPSPAADAFWNEVNDRKNQVIGMLGGIPLAGDDLSLKRAGMGGVAHEVGTLRLSENGDGVVDADLKFLSYANLYACDLSVFPSSPAANPTLTLGALAIRLADHLKTKL